MFLNQLNQTEKEVFLKLAISIVSADEIIGENEQRIIADYAHEMSIPVFDLNSNFDVKRLCSQINETASKSVKHIFLLELVACALADGDFGKEEKQLIDSMINYFNLSENELTESITLLQEYSTITTKLTHFIQGEQ